MKIELNFNGNREKLKVLATEMGELAGRTEQDGIKTEMKINGVVI